ncbi:tetratricopeptide repeat protein [Candidatus Poribacteria bacterium]|nr:tetratricopeptide repeat protein [Candidatus Poribacteria bacterium]
MTGYPAILFVSPDGGLIKHHIGFALPEQFLPVMEEAIKLETDFQEKLAKFQKMPDDLPLNREMAKLYLQRYQVEKAEPILAKMPDDVDLNRDFAIYYLGKNQIDKALLIKEKMPDDVKLNYEFVKTYLNQGQFGEALILSDMILASDPKNTSGILPDMHYDIALSHARMIGRVNEELKQGYFETAAAHFQIIIDKYPDSIRNEISQLYLGVVYSLVGQYDTSIEILEKLISQTSDENMKKQAETNLKNVRQSAADAAANDN